MLVALSAYTQEWRDVEQRYQFLLLLTSLKFFICLLLLLSRFSRVRLYATHRRQPIRLRRPWDSPGKNTGVSCHFLLQCMKVKSESEVAQLCPILSDPMDCSLPGSSVHGIFQARVLEWGTIAFSDNFRAPVFWSAFLASLQMSDTIPGCLHFTGRGCSPWDTHCFPSLPRAGVLPSQYL